MKWCMQHGGSVKVGERGGDFSLTFSAVGLGELGGGGPCYQRRSFRDSPGEKARKNGAECSSAICCCGPRRCKLLRLGRLTEALIGALCFAAQVSCSTTVTAYRPHSTAAG